MSEQPRRTEGDGEQVRRGATGATLRDVATESGVSMSTASRVLNNAPATITIPDETRERIEQTAQRLGFRPNPFARALRGAPTMLLGAIVRDFSDPFFAAAIEVLAVEAHARGYSIVLGHVQEGDDETRAARAVLTPGHCDAILVLGELEDRPRLREELSRVSVPVVALWQGNSRILFPTVDVDDTIGVPVGLQHLIDLGHQRIAFVSARLPGDNPTRERAYVELIDEHFGAVPEGYLQRCDNTLAGGEQAAEALLRLPVRPTAVACSTDVAAVGVLHAAHDQGIAVPGELSVVGYDDLMFAAYANPALTTLRMPTEAIVREAIRVAITLTLDPLAQREPSRTTYEPTLIARSSTAAPAD